MGKAKKNNNISSENTELTTNLSDENPNLELKSKIIKKIRQEVSTLSHKPPKESLSYFEYLPLKMRNDKNFITPYITKSPGLIRFLGKQVFNDVEFVNSFSNTDMISKFSIYSRLLTII